MPRVLITGAAGFIGMHTAIKFLENGWDVIGLDNFNNYYSTALKRDRIKEIDLVALKCDLSFKLFEKDLNSDVWDDLLKYEIDSVVHLAAQAGVRYSLQNPEAYIESNILGFQRVLKFVLNKGIEKFLYASSSSVYGKNSKQPFSENAACDAPESYYAATKRANELMARSYFNTHGMVSIGLRFFTVYGPWGRPDMAPMLFAKAAAEKGQIKVFNYGKQQRDFTYISDIVNSIYLLVIKRDIKNHPEIFNIGCGDPIKLLDFIQIIEDEFSIVLEKDFVKAQPGDVEMTFADTRKLQKTIGFKPSISLVEGVCEFSKWYKEYYQC